MDELWLLDGPLGHPDIPDHRPRVEVLRRRALRTRLRHALHRAARGEPQRLATLVRYEASRSLGTTVQNCPFGLLYLRHGPTAASRAE